MKDAPLLWFLTHAGAMEEFGMACSILRKALFLLFDEAGELDGLLGVHRETGYGESVQVYRRPVLCRSEDAALLEQSQPLLQLQTTGQVRRIVPSSEQRQEKTRKV